MDLLIPRTILNGLYTRIVGSRLSYLLSTSSTMDEATHLAANGAMDGTVVISENQTDGRGRFQRKWISEPGNLYISVVLRPPIEILPYISIMSGVAVVRSISRMALVSASIKWPNDVMINDKKVGGILVENTLKGSIVQYCIIGIGINVAFDPGSDVVLNHVSTNLNRETGLQTDRNGLVRVLLQELDYIYTKCNIKDDPKGIEDGITDVLNEWKILLNTLGRHVQIRWNQDLHSGYAEDVDSYGNLTLRMEDGSTVSLPAGEVTFHTS